MSFSDIPIRSNDQRIDASWFNTIRTKLVSGGSSGVLTKSSDYSAALGENCFLLDGTSNTVTLTLPTPTDGIEILVKAINITNTVSIDTSSGTIESGASFTFSFLDEAILVKADGTNWHIFSRFIDNAVDLNTAQILTNKTIDANNNTISNLAHGAEVDNPTSGVHGVTGSVVGTTDIQTLTNKTIDVDNNTLSNIEVDNLKAGVLDTDLSSVSASDDTLASAKAIKAYVDTGDSTVDADTVTVSNLEVDNLKAGVLDTDLSSVSASDDTLASAKAIKAYVDANAGESNSIYSTATDYTITDSDGYNVILVTDTTALRTITLPTAADNTNRIITIKNISTQKGIARVDGEGSEQVEGQNAIDLDFKNASITVACNGTAWYILHETITTSHDTYSLTVTGTNWTTARAVGRFYRTLDGNWYINATITGSVSSAVSTLNLDIANIGFEGTSGNYQAFALAMGSGDSYARNAVVLIGTNDLELKVFGGGTATNFRMTLAEIELSGRPTVLD